MSSNCSTGATALLLLEAALHSLIPRWAHSYPSHIYPTTTIAESFKVYFFSSQAKVMFSSIIERIWMKVFSEDGRSIMDGKDIQSNEFPEKN